jgi:hypothetical protein
MTIRELAEADLKYTLENPNGSGTSFTLITPDGMEYSVIGTVGDIGIFYEPATGESTRNRSIVCTCRIRTLAEQTPLIPERGWKAVITDLQGKIINLFVNGNDPDRTLGLYRLTMGLDLEEQYE